LLQPHEALLHEALSRQPPHLRIHDDVEQRRVVELAVVQAAVVRAVAVLCFAAAAGPGAAAPRAAAAAGLAPLTLPDLGVAREGPPVAHALDPPHVVRLAGPLDDADDNFALEAPAELHELHLRLVGAAVVREAHAKVRRAVGPPVDPQLREALVERLGRR
jgi:hypothetical protein